MKKILITYATAGVGHKKAAFAVRDALVQGNNDCIVEMIDVLDRTNAFFRRSYPVSYLILINRMIYLWQFLYYFLDLTFVHRVFYYPRVLSHIMNSLPLIRYVREFKPDVVISTHFLMPDVALYLKKRYGMKMRVINVITDYRVHSFWVSGGVDTYMVAYEETKKDLVGKWGIPEKAVIQTGIPVEPKFSLKHDRAYFRRQHSIPEDAFVILLLSGGYGMGPVFETLKALERAGVPLTVLVICGHNEALCRKVDLLAKSSGIKIINHSYVNNIDELMAVSDLYIGKAGGISTSESLVMNLPCVFIRPIPGQESRNADLVVSGGAGVTVKHIGEISSIVKELFDDRSKIEKMRQKSALLAKPNASRDIALFALRS